METTSILVPSDRRHVVITTVSSMRYISYAIGAVGLIGNTFVVVVIMSRTSMRRQWTNAYIINQSIIDGVAAFFLIMTTAIENNGDTIFRTGLDDFICRFWFSKLWLWGFFVSSTYNLLALTTERYLSIVHPIWHKTKLNKNKVVASIAAVWLFGPTFDGSFLLSTSGITSNGTCSSLTFWPSVKWQRVVGVVTIIVQYIAPLLLLIFFYTRMVITVRKRILPEAAGSSGQRRPTNNLERAKKNILKTLAMVACNFVFCWTWNQIYFLSFNLGSSSIDLTSVFYNFTVVMVFMNCCVNPFIYIAKYEEFQKATRILFWEILRRPNAEQTSTSSENSL